MEDLHRRDLVIEENTRSAHHPVTCHIYRSASSLPELVSRELTSMLVSTWSITVFEIPLVFRHRILVGWDLVTSKVDKVRRDHLEEIYHVRLRNITVLESNLHWNM
jgi:hypothetical protein